MARGRLQPLALARQPLAPIARPARAPAGANGKEVRAPAGANSKETLAPAGANSQPPDAAVLQALGRIEEQMGRLEQQQALLLEAQEGHYEDVEELEGTVEKIAEAETNILDNLEADSRKARTTVENCAAIANAGKDVVWGLVGLGGLALGLWLLFWKPVALVAKAKASSPTPTPEEESAPAKTPSTVPSPAKVGIRKME